MVVRSRENLERELELWKAQLRDVYGGAALFAERYVDAARHIQITFARTRQGAARVFPPVDGSLQLKDRKLVEICPAPNLSSALVARMNGYVQLLAEKSGYIGVGSVDFLCDGEQVYLLGGSPRLPASFRMVEEIQGESLVRWQLAAAGILEEESVRKTSAGPSRFAGGVCARIYAEDALLELPRPGKVLELSPERVWEFPRSRAEWWCGVSEGGSVGFDEDGLVGVFLAWGADTKAAIHTAARFVGKKESPLWIAGTLQTNERYLGELLDHPWVREGYIHASFIEEEFIPTSEPSLEEIRIVGRMVAHLLQKEFRGEWVLQERLKIRAVEEKGWHWKDLAVGPGLSGWLVGPLKENWRVSGFELSEGVWQLRFGATFLLLRKALPGASDGSRKLRSLVSGRVAALRYQEGVRVPAGEALIWVRSERRAIPHALGKDVEILRWHVRPDQDVFLGDLLADLRLSP